MSAEEFDKWWVSVEQAAATGCPGPETHPELANAYVALIEGRLEDARGHLEASGPVAGVWGQLERLLRLQTEAARTNRDGLLAAAEELAKLYEGIPVSAPGFRARVRHLQAATTLRTGRPFDAEGLAAAALAELPKAEPHSLRRAWILDTLGSCYHRTGAWHQGNAIFKATLALKEAAGDTTGVGITAGSWGRLALEADKPRQALAVAQRGLTREALLARKTRLRLHTLALDALLELDEDTSACETALRELIGDGSRADDLVGYAYLSLARALRRSGGEPEPDLDHADAIFTLPFPRILLTYWRRVILPSPQAPLAWLAELQSLIDHSNQLSHGEVLARCHVARELVAIDRAAANRVLDELAERVRGSNSELWFRMLDGAGMEVDSLAASRRHFQRFAGRERGDAFQSRREESTIVFADLVAFTRRSTTLSAEEVMKTVRSLYELASPLLHELGVRPLQYLGDGLLAVATGFDHRARGLAFSLAFTERMRRVTLLAEILAGQQLPIEKGMLVRCGVATGPVVLGPIGNLLKTDFTCIGLTANRAARLQGYAAPAEVVCDASLGEIAEANGGEVIESLRVTPKGFPEEVSAARLRPSPSFVDPWGKS